MKHSQRWRQILFLRTAAWGGAGALVCAVAACSGPVEPGWAGYAEGEYLYLAASVGGTLTDLAVQKGQDVAAGAPLFRLDDTAQAAARAQAAAQVAQARAQAANTTKGRRADELAVTRAQLAQAQAQVTRAEAELRRQRELVAQNFVSRSRLDDAAAAAAQARDKVAELQAALRSAGLPARADEQAAARAGVAAAEQALAQARWREQQAAQTAPAAALVAETYFRAGEFVPAGQPVVALLPVAARKARFFIAEAELGAVAVGQAVTLHCDGCGAPIAARISRIAPQPEYTPPVIYSNAQRARLVFMAEAVPVAAQDATRLHPGQPLDVRRAAAAPRQGG